MHEIAIASRVLREARKAGATRYLRVEVGELVEITPKEMEEGLKKLTQSVVNEDDLHAGGRLLAPVAEIGELEVSEWGFKVDFKESKIKCECGYLGRAKIVDRGHGYCVFNCPQCGKKPKVLEGGEIKVVEVE